MYMLSHDPLSLWCIHNVCGVVDSCLPRQEPDLHHGVRPACPPGKFSMKEKHNSNCLPKRCLGKLDISVMPYIYVLGITNSEMSILLSAQQERCMFQSSSNKILIDQRLRKSSPAHSCKNVDNLFFSPTGANLLSKDVKNPATMSMLMIV